MYVYDSTTPASSNTVLLPRSWDKEYHILKTASYYSAKHEFKIENVPDAVNREQLMKRFKEGARRIQVPAGGLLIFNSRTIHQGYPSGLRFAQPISWEPRMYMNDAARLRKLQAVYTGIATTHWGAKGEHHGASFLRPKVSKYSEDEEDCVFPMKDIVPWPLISPPDKHVKSLSMEQLLARIKPEYLPYI